MFNNDGTIKRAVWRNLFVIALGIAAVGGAAGSTIISILGLAAMLYSGWYFVQTEE